MAAGADERVVLLNQGQDNFIRCEENALVTCLGVEHAALSTSDFTFENKYVVQRYLDIPGSPIAVNT